MQPLVDFMLSILGFFYQISGNYGIAIILLTVLVKIALYPLTLKSTQQMVALQKLQPKIKELQAKYKDDPKRLQGETMDYYRSEGVNPLGGCFPMLLQLPVFLALFFALTDKKFLELVNNGGNKAAFLWITNLTRPDPSNILVVLIAVTTYYTQKTMPTQPSGPMNSQFQTWFMPLFIAFISIPFPAGLQLYWVVSNAVTIAQQVYLLRKFHVKHL